MLKPHQLPLLPFNQPDLAVRPREKTPVKIKPVVRKHGSSDKPELAYLVSKFPTVTETFILREIIEVERAGLPLALYTIRRETPEVIHDDARPWLDRLHEERYQSVGLWTANLKMLLKKPGLYLSLLVHTIREQWGSWHLLPRDLASFPLAVAFAQHMQAAGIKHVHAHWATHTAYMAYIIHRLTGISYSFTAHAHDIYIRKGMLPTKVKAARFVATISRFNVEELVNDCGEKVRSKIHVVRCGVAPERFQPRSTKRDPQQPFTILSVASLRDYKGHPYAIQACKILKDKIPNFRWLVAGSGPDKKLLTQMIKEAGLEGIYCLLGSRSESQINQLMQDADVFALGSIMMEDRRMEGIPVALMEALAVELPTVATKISGISELVEDGVTGRLVPERDPQALADAILDLKDNPDKATRLAKAGRQRILNEFTVEANAHRLVELFDQVLSR